LTACRAETTPQCVNASRLARILVVLLVLLPLGTQAHRGSWLCGAQGQRVSDDCTCPHANSDDQAADSRLNAVPCCATVPGSLATTSLAFLKPSPEASPKPQVALEAFGVLDFDSADRRLTPAFVTGARSRPGPPLYLALRTLLR
jgi:hypothetical protein